MLNEYISWNYTRIYSNTPGEISGMAGYGYKGWAKAPRSQGCRSTPRSYRDKKASVWERQTAIGRVRAALVAAIGHDGRFDHAAVGAIARQILKCARHVRLDRDNPATHLAFSPDGISSRNLRGRRSLAFGRFLRRKCSDLLRGRLALTDKQIDLASAAFPVRPEIKLNLGIAYGDDAYEIYADHEHGIESCMSGLDDDDNDKSRFIAHHLTANPEKIGVIWARHQGQLILRTKLFHNDNGSLWFGRIYWKRQGPLVSVEREQDITPLVQTWLVSRYPDKPLSDTCNCTLTHERGEYMPYLDRQSSFDRLDESTIRIHPSGRYEASSSAGDDPSADDRNSCHNCGCRIDDERTVWDEDGQPYCEDCHGEIYTYDELHECELHRDDAMSAYRTGYRGRRETITTHQNNTVETVEGDIWVRGDDAIVELRNGDWTELDNAVCTADGDYELIEDCEEILDSGEYDLRENLTQLSDGRWACDDDTVETIDGSIELIEDCVPFMDDYGNEVYRLATAADMVQAS